MSDSDNSTLDGLPAADGLAQATVRWVHEESDAADFPAGAIMLARMTSPDWGTVYQRAAGIATIEGGMLCHAAQVAREEGIPAVVGIGRDLEAVEDGTFVELNGDAGTISWMNTSKGDSE